MIVYFVVVEKPRHSTYSTLKSKSNSWILPFSNVFKCGCSFESRVTDLAQVTVFGQWNTSKQFRTDQIPPPGSRTSYVPWTLRSCEETEGTRVCIQDFKRPIRTFSPHKFVIDSINKAHLVLSKGKCADTKSLVHNRTHDFLIVRFLASFHFFGNRIRFY